MNWLFWITGAAAWAGIVYCVGDRLVRTAIFANRMGWKQARRFDLATWADFFVSPPDAVGQHYWPSKSGVAMRRRHEND